LYSFDFELKDLKDFIIAFANISKDDGVINFNGLFDAKNDD